MEVERLSCIDSGPIILHLRNGVHRPATSQLYISLHFSRSIQKVWTRKMPERWRTSHDQRCNVPSPQSPFAMTDRHTQTNGSDSITLTAYHISIRSHTKFRVRMSNCESTELQTDTHEHTHTGPILLPRPLRQEVKRIWLRGSVQALCLD